ncbi:Methionine synthase [bioreactor metagenome]|uniref:methionine synthase n=1 Tax=bioreactor metagenome TaxID=1076179 RepID=A0A644XHD3_9ZZZZ
MFTNAKYAKRQTVFSERGNPMEFLSALQSKRLFFDGAMGTMLQSAGLPQGMLPDLFNLQKPEAVKAVHRAYLDAGCRILKTNTFGAVPLKLAPFGAATGDVAAAAVSLAKSALREAECDGFVALDLGPTGKLLKPYGDLDFEDAVSQFAAVVRAGAEAGADCVLIETMSDTYELKAAVLAAKENCSLPVLATLIFDEKGKLLTGGDIPAAVALLEGLGVSALGFNCGMGPAQMRPLVEELLRYTSLPIIVNPNAGLPRYEAGKTVFDITPDKFAREITLLAPSVTLLGGCCGTTPGHLAAMIAACKDIPLPSVTRKDTLLISSYGGAVAFGADPVVIGERINPTGKKRLQQALRENDMDYVLREGLDQQTAGAQILDVNVGVPGLDETILLRRTAEALQSVTPLPLQLDSSNPAALEAAMRRYNGKPLVNSVSGKWESLEAILPLVKKYGGGLVCLTLDEKGIPETAAGRLSVARRIIGEAEDRGIDRRELLIDVLTLPVSAGDRNGAVTLEALRMVREQLGVKTVLGVSNVSFGLPKREQMSAAFFTLALGAGLSAAIINPKSQPMMDALAACRSLAGLDPRCAGYIKRFGDSPEAPAPSGTSDLTLKEAVCRGLGAEAARLAGEAARSGDAMEVIQSSLVPALDEVGSSFEKGVLFLPQLLMSAEAAKKAFDALRPYLSSGEESGGPKIVLATVKGDIHDIGKNIVKVLLENYRFTVIDLGRDVAPEAILEASLREDVKLVGLSALMTTTVPFMEETVRLLAKEKPDCRVMVGGAVLTRSYADSIGAHFYAKDAMAAVHCARQVFGEA